jgi:hypothetical protein
MLAFTVAESLAAAGLSLSEERCTLVFLSLRSEQ